MANDDVEERPVDVHVDVDGDVGKVKVGGGGDCNGIAKAKENGHDPVADAVVIEPDHAESAPDMSLDSESIEAEAVEKSDGSLSDEIKAEKGEGGLDNGENKEQQVQLGSEEKTPAQEEEEKKVQELPAAEEVREVEDQELPKVVESNSEENAIEESEREPDKQSEHLDSQTQVNPGELESSQGEEIVTTKSAVPEESVQNQDSTPSVLDSESESESESLQLGNGDKVEEEASVQVGQDVQLTPTQPVETEPCKAGEPADYVLVDKPSLDVEAENVSSDDVQVETETANDTVPVEQPSLESVVTSEKQDQSEIDTTVSETPIENGHVESAESSSSVVEVKPELDVEDVSAENEEAVMSDTVATPDVNLSGEGDESMSACPIDNLESESVGQDDAIEGNQNTLETANVEDEIGGKPNTPSLEQTVSENEMSNDSVEEQERSSTGLVAQIISESSDVNGNVENAALSSSSVEVKPEADVEVYAANGDTLSDSQVPCTNVEVSAKGDDNTLVSSVNDLKPESVLTNGSIEKNHSIPSKPDHDIGRENGTDDIVEHIKLPAGADSELESGAINSSTGKDELTAVSLLSKGPVVSDESDPDFKADVKSSEGIDSNGISPEDSATGALEATKVECEVENKPFRYLIKIPRYVDEKYSSQIELAQKQVDEKTRNREELKLKIQSRRATASEHRDKFEAARSEERASRSALSAKRKEMDSVLSVINRMKNATSVEDMNERVRNMEHRIEHETVPLKEEKQLIREIKQLKQQLREQLSSSSGQQDEIEPTADEKVKIEERFKLLKQEMESHRKEVLRFEEITKAAWKVYSDENEKVKELQSQFRAADNLRQEAYTQLHNIKKQMYEKNQYFRTFNEDIMRAKDYASSRDREALHSHCTNQVDKIMELWNNNEEFRKEYIRCNKMSTLRRLRTADGRALGPEEQAPVLYNVRDQKADSSLLGSANKINFPSLPASEKGKSVGQDVVNVEQKPKVDSKVVVNLGQKSSTLKSKTMTKAAAASENSRVTVSGKEDKEENAEESKRIREAEELARKEEELRQKEEELYKKEEAAKLKEQRRLEEKAKAKEAEERKRRNAEKAQARAELRAQKEAELKEKEREKKARKKERKKEKVEAVTGGDETESVPRSENTQPETSPEPEMKEKPKTVVKRPLLAKQAKPKVIPPPLPLRNRGKKRMQQWMWILLAVVIVLALFLVGNIGFSFKFGLPSFQS